jgi:rieske iron-sulfur protein
MALRCPTAARRLPPLTALATGACPSTNTTAAAEERPASDERSQKGDLLVLSEGGHAGEKIRPDDLKPGGQPLHAWPKDPKFAVLRDGSRLNESLLVKLDPNELDDGTRARAADGIVAYSAICVHAGGPGPPWSSGDKNVLNCLRPNSEYDPDKAHRSCSAPHDAAWRRLNWRRRRFAHGRRNIIGKVGGQQAG